MSTVLCYVLCSTSQDKYHKVLHNKILKTWSPKKLPASNIFSSFLKETTELGSVGESFRVCCNSTLYRVSTSLTDFRFQPSLKSDGHFSKVTSISQLYNQFVIPVNLFKVFPEKIINLQKTQSLSCLFLASWFKMKIKVASQQCFSHTSSNKLLLECEFFNLSHLMWEMEGGFYAHLGIFNFILQTCPNFKIMRSVISVSQEFRLQTGQTRFVLFCFSLLTLCDVSESGYP